MAFAVRRTLFWRIYLTLLFSLVLAALLGASLWRLLVEPMYAAPGALILHRHAGHHMLGMLLAIAAAVALAAYPVISGLTRRLERLRASVDAWGSGRLDRRADARGGDEVAAVAHSFNAAADRIEALLAAHRSLLAHASHELRSPLARLRLAIEMFPADPSPALAAAIAADIGELDGLVDEILLASRLDQAAAAVEEERVDLLALAAEEAARVGASLTVGAGIDACCVQGSPRLLRRMIRNLLDNAARHGRPPIAVELARRDGMVTLWVRDEGPGIPQAERARVFEPFYRPSGRAEAAVGWGLGLSIVRQIAERHGGDVACAPGPGGGFTASLPAA
jgi:signal transduction histidine kinase